MSLTNPDRNVTVDDLQYYEQRWAHHNLATIEPTTTASKAYAVGDYLVYSGQLYKVTTAITSGGTIVTSGVSANVEATTVTDELGGGSGDISENEITFTSDDSSSPSSFTNIAVVTTGEKLSSLMRKLSQAIANIRWLNNKIVWYYEDPVSQTINANTTKFIYYESGGNAVVSSMLVNVRKNNSSGELIQESDESLSKISHVYTQVIQNGSKKARLEIKNGNSFAIYVTKIRYYFANL